MPDTLTVHDRIKAIMDTAPFINGYVIPFDDSTELDESLLPLYTILPPGRAEHVISARNEKVTSDRDWLVIVFAAVVPDDNAQGEWDAHLAAFPLLDKLPVWWARHHALQIESDEQSAAGMPDIAGTTLRDDGVRKFDRGSKTYTVGHFLIGVKDSKSIY